jgi:hypothetical protein
VQVIVPVLTIELIIGEPGLGKTFTVADDKEGQLFNGSVAITE